MIYKGLLFDGQAVIYAGNTTKLVEDARKTHNLTPVCCAALGRTLTAAALMGCTFKHEDDRMSITIKGDGPIGSIVVAVRNDLKLKGYVNNPLVDLPLNEFGKLDVSGAVGAGTLTVIKDLGLKEPYVGTVELQSSEIGDDIAHYLLTSEQTPSLCYLGVLVDTDYTIKSSGGIIITPLPGCSDEVIEKIEANALNIAKFNRMLSQGLGDKYALEQLFGEMSLKITEELQEAFDCDCSRERMEQVLISIGKKDLMEIANEDGKAEIICHFCREKHCFNKQELLSLVEEA